MSKVAMGVSLLVLAAIGNVSEAADRGRPNVVMIFCDDMGYGDVSSFAGKPQPVRTPNIDRLAAGGRKFTRFYVGSPVCSPSRAAVLSGRFASETGLRNFLHTREHNRQFDQNDYLDPRLGHLPRAFDAAGYATAHFGKWHLGGGRDVDNAPSIKEYGYDEYSTTWESPDPDPRLGADAPGRGEKGKDQVKQYERTAYQVDKTVDFLRRHKAEPCFVTLWTNDLHATYHPSPAARKKHGGVDKPTATYENFLGVLEEYDREIGRLLDEIKRMGLEENTIVFFTGDNGAPQINAAKRNGGFRGSKLTLYEGGIREPFVIRWPGRVPAGTVNDVTVLSAVDLLPTLTTLAGVELPGEAKGECDGEDLSAAVLGAEVKRAKALYWQNLMDRPADAPRGPSLGIRKGDWKLLVNRDGSDAELYDVRKDPEEKRDVAGGNGELVKEMAGEVRGWAETLPGRTHP
jgi:arylsulfatase A-like enzyme